MSFIVIVHAMCMRHTHLYYNHICDIRMYMPIGEMTQMAGRAGRRGKDKVGTVIIAAWSDLPFEPQLQQLLTGLATKLVSKFR